MAHKHSVYDTDLHFFIDPITRKITSDSGKVSLMQNDHNSERFTFQIPRYVDGHDMSLCNVVQVHYVNTDSKNKRNENKDIYEVTDLQIAPGDKQVVIGSWLISQNATKYGGTLNFIFRFACVSGEDSTLDYQWFSDIYKVIQVVPGIYNVDVATKDNDTDLLEAWKLELTTISANAAKEVIDAGVEEIETIRDSGVATMNGIRDKAIELVDNAETTMSVLSEKVSGTEFMVNWETGELEYESPDYEFVVNEETGNMEYYRTMTEGNVVERTIDQYSAGKADALTRTIEGETMVFEDSAYAPMAGLRVFGKTEQVITTGAQLFDANALNLDTNVSLDVSDDGYIIKVIGGTSYAYSQSRAEVDISSLIGKRLYMVVDSLIGTNGLPGNSRIQCSMNHSDGTVTYHSIPIDSLTGYFDIPEDATKLLVGIYTNNSGSALETDNTVVVKGLRLSLTENAPWEPYSGGKASPNPEYPQELVSVGDDGAITARTYGANLVNLPITNATTSGVTIDIDDTGLVTLNGTANSLVIWSFNLDDILNAGKTIRVSANNDTVNNGARLRLSGDTGTDLNCMFGVVNASVVGALTMDANKLQIRIAEGTVLTDFKIRPMLSYGETNHAYEMYKMRSLEINHTLPAIPVTDASLATYTDQNGVMWCADEVDFDRGVYVQRIASETITAEKIRSISNDYVDAGGSYCWAGLSNVAYTNEMYATVMSDMGYPISLYNRTHGDYIDRYRCYIVNGDSVILRYPVSEGEKTFEDAKNDFAGTKVHYILATPIEIPLSNSELQAFRSLYTNYPITTIMNDSGAHMEVTYNADTKNYIAAEHAKMMAEMKALISS